MNFLFQIFLITFSLFFTDLTAWGEKDKSQNQEIGQSPSLYISQDLWEYIHPYLMTDKHPIKKKLDKIFSKSRALCDIDSMVAAGFDYADPQHHTHIIVTRHSSIKGYVVKAYLDNQDYHLGEPEYFFWMMRADGANLISQFIKKHGYHHLFKVPKKWIYLLPDVPSPPLEYLRKNFILVEEDMNIFDTEVNQKIWGGPLVTKKLLKGLYKITTELGLFDCAKPANCPFSKDGRVAFVDTQSFHRKSVKYKKLTPYLSTPMQNYWNDLTTKD